MRRLWLLFAQATTIALGVLLAVSVFRPDWLPNHAASVTVKEIASSGGTPGHITSFSDAVKRAMPAVVNIHTSKEVKIPRHPLFNDPIFRHFFGDRFGGAETRQISSLGSGVIVSPEGYILTNHHVVAAADEIQVALADGRNAAARIVGSDPDTDLAVLKIELKKLPTITFGHDEQAKVGDVVLAIGNPFGVGQTVTMGIVSALSRSHLGINTFENFIQTDAAINPGNSGGALVDASGNLIGINSAIYSRTGGSLGIGFAIPVSLAKQVMEQIIQQGGVTRGWVGVEAQDLTPELAESFGLPATQGALIAGVLRGAPADQAGIKPGDILLGINGKPVNDSNAMLNLIASLPPDKMANLKLLRGRSEFTLQVKVGKRPRAQQRNDDLLEDN